MSNIKLRDYQETAVQEVRLAFRAKQEPVLFVLPTGGGKTYTFSYIADSAARLGRVVIIIVHRKELLLQASQSLSNLGIDHGLISPDFTPNIHAMVQVASVDTLILRLKIERVAAVLRRCGLVIFDEAHHVVASNKWGRCYEALGQPPMLGVTATPVRTDGKGLGEHAGGLFKKMVLGPSVSALIERAMLIAPQVYTSLDLPDLSDIKPNRDGTDNLKAISERVDKPKITGSAVEHYRELCSGRRAIVFCSSIEHAKHVRDEFNAAGFRFELLVGAPEMSDSERTDVNKRLRRGEIHGACTVDLVSEGYDLPDLEVCIMLRPTASEALFIQQVGRVMRPSEGKTTCWLLDHVGNVGAMIDGAFKRKHGLPTEEREWTLDGRKKKGKAKKAEDDTIKLKQCPKCYIVHEPTPKCPSCGHEYQVASRQVEQVDGQLQQITPAMAEALKAQRKKELSKAKTEEELKAYAAKHGYSEGWAKKMLEGRKKAAEKYRRPTPPIEVYFDR